MRNLAIALLSLWGAGCEMAPVPVEQGDTQEALGDTPELQGQQRQLPTGTYRFTLCYPSCSDSSSYVGAGILVVTVDAISPLYTWALQDIRKESVFLLLDRGDPLPANACFRVSARRRVAGREYYPGIIPVGLTSVQRDSTGSFAIGLYKSPDASFYAVVHSDERGRFSGIGWQHDCCTSDHGSFGTIEGTSIGSPNPAACFGG